MHAVSWLHLSDFHCGMAAQGWLWPNVREHFLEDLARLHERTGPWSFVFFTGDLTQCGTREEFARLNAELHEIYEHMKSLGSQPLLLAVPGNHDLVRPLANDPALRALRAGWFDEKQPLRDFYWSRDPQRAPYHQMITDAFAPYVEWYLAWREEHPLPPEATWLDGELPGDFSLRWSTRGIGVSVIGLNSAVLQLDGGDYKGLLDLSARQLSAVCRGEAPRFLTEHPHAFLLTHHPPSWLHPIAGNELRSEIAPPQRFAAHLHGHMHEPQSRSVSIGGSAPQLRLQGASLFGLEKTMRSERRIHGFSVGRLELDGERSKVRCWPRILHTTLSGERRIVQDSDFSLQDESFSAPYAPPRSAKHVPAVAVRLPSAPALPVLDADSEDLIKGVASERLSHLSRFIGRAELLANLQGQIRSLQRSGGYLLLVANEGFGKSALCAKLSDALASAAEPLAHPLGKLAALAPWLPGCLFYMGKQTASPHDVVRLLLVQAGAVLGAPLPVPAGRDSDIEHMALLSMTQQQLGVAPGPRNPEWALARHRRALSDALEQIVRARGSAVLIVDAADEMGADGRVISFLPESLPPGVAVLITARPGAVAEWLTDRRAAVRQILPALERTDVPLWTGISDEASDASRSFNDALHRQSAGWPLLVSSVARDVKLSGGRFERVRIDGTIEHILNRQARAWTAQLVRGRDGRDLDPLHTLLLLLALFEPAAPLPLSALQAYLVHRGIELPRGQRELQDLLAPVSEQLQGLDVGQVRLATKPFADHVRERYVSPSDRRTALSHTADWLASDEDLGGEPLGRFLAHWLDADSADDLREKEIVERVITALNAQRKFERLSSLASLLWELDDDSPVALRCARLAAQGGHHRAMELLGERQVMGQGVPQDVPGGERLLRAAMAAGSLRAKTRLGYLLCFGYGVSLDAEAGLALLQEAASSGSPAAMFFLGHALVAGVGGAADLSGGRAWMNQAALQAPELREFIGFLLVLHSEDPLEKRLAELERRLQTSDALDGELLAGLRDFQQVKDEAIRRLEQLLHEAAGKQTDGLSQDDFVALSKRVLKEMLRAEAQLLPVAIRDALYRAIDQGSYPFKEVLQMAARQHDASRHLSAGYEAYDRGERDEAARLFLAAYRGGAAPAGNNLVYMARRGEVPAELSLPPSAELLAPLVSAKDPFGILNAALAQAAGFEQPADWVAADLMLQGLKDVPTGQLDGAVQWWHGLASAGDGEGDLVLGWLARQGLIPDPDGRSIAERFAAARRARWAVPEEMDPLAGEPTKS